LKPAIRCRAPPLEFHFSANAVSQELEVARFGTPYQAALLMNGSVYFGHLQDYGTSHPFLTEVFYVVSQTDTETKHVKSSLIKRGKEMREPDRMYLNQSQIVFVETVGSNSNVAQLIAQASQLTLASPI
jgi:hypothetical protein